MSPAAAPSRAVGPWPLAVRLLRRDWRSGELYLLAGALILTVAAITAVGFFTDRIEGAMQRQGGELIAADLAIEATSEIGPAFADKARTLGLTTAQTLSFRSVVLNGERSQLVQVKGVGAGYPLRGELRVKQSPDGPERASPGGPASGEVWVETRLLYQLALKVGDPLRLGNTEFRIGRILTYEPDRGGSFVQIAPRVMMRLDEVGATGLVNPASRVRHRLLAAGPADAVQALADWAEPRLSANAGLIDAREARPELETAVDRAGRFLSLAALTTLLVAGAAIALASRRLVERQTDAVAVMRCLGAPRHLLTRIFILRLLLFGLLASLAGCLLGWLAQQGLILLLADWFGTDLPAASWEPIGVGLATGMAALAGFALPPLLHLADVPPLRVLRRDLGAPKASMLLAIGAAVGVVVLMVFWQAGDPALAWKLLAGVAGAVLGLVLLGALLVWLARLASYRSRGIWRLGLAGLARRPTAAILQIVGFGLGILALLLLAVVRLDLLSAWQESLPEGAPNQFLINIQPHEVEPLRGFLEDRGLDGSGIFPMIRGRLTGIGGAAVEPADYESPRAQRLAERDFNLSFAIEPQSDNEITAGRWWQGPDAPPQFSVDVGIAETLGIELGDELRFFVAGQEIAAPVTSLREVHWDSFNVNFFIIAPPSLLADQPATYITSFHLPPAREALVPELLGQFPGVTVIDVGALLDQVRGVVDQGIRAVEYVFVFTLAAGILVMYAGIQSSLAVRRTEHGVLRTLGTGRGPLLRSLLIEFTAAGVLAGLVASLFAELTGQVLARELLDVASTFNPWLWVIGVAGSGLLIGLAGTLGSYGMLVRPPLQALRQTD